MSSIRKIGKNIFSLFTGQLISSFLAVILSIYIARTLGQTIFGSYSFVITFVALFSVFFDLGYETLLIKEVAKDKLNANKYLNNIIIIRVVLAIIIFSAIFLIINALNFSNTIKNMIYIFGIAQIITSLSNLFRVTFRAFERMHYEAIISIITSILKCSLGLIVIFFGYGLIALALVFLYIAIVDFIINLIICEKKIVKTTLQFDRLFFRHTIKNALALGTVTIFALIYVRIDTVMLELMKGDAVVGWYNAAYNLILGFNPVPVLFMNTLLPLMAYTYVKSNNSLRNIYEKSFKFLLIFGLPITVGIFLLSDKFIILFYGQNFLNSIGALKILSFDILLKFLYLCLWFVLISADQQYKLAICAGGGAILNITLNLFLIPQFSLYGAAIATIITETYILLMYLYLAHRNNLKIPLKKIFLKPVIACSVMGLFIYYFSGMNLYLLISFSIFIYFGIFFLLKGFSKEELSLLKQIFKNKKSF
ncbi:MAG: flippase [Candidatus Thermoplasmatota archaeon]|nr:flippase [Candidatus Thermoplasmatota archaeon]